MLHLLSLTALSSIGNILSLSWSSCSSPIYGHLKHGLPKNNGNCLHDYWIEGRQQRCWRFAMAEWPITLEFASGSYLEGSPAFLLSSVMNPAIADGTLLIWSSLVSEDLPTPQLMATNSIIAHEFVFEHRLHDLHRLFFYMLIISLLLTYYIGFHLFHILSLALSSS